MKQSCLPSKLEHINEDATWRNEIVHIYTGVVYLVLSKSCLKEIQISVHKQYVVPGAHKCRKAFATLALNKLLVVPIGLGNFPSFTTVFICLIPNQTKLSLYLFVYLFCNIVMNGASKNAALEERMVPGLLFFV